MSAAQLSNSDQVTNAFESDSRQPSGLRVIFFAEMWERFSYYGMRSLLVLYLINSLSYTRDNALALYGIYTGLVYLTPIYGRLICRFDLERNDKNKNTSINLRIR